MVSVVAANSRTQWRFQKHQEMTPNEDGKVEVWMFGNGKSITTEV